MKKLVALSFIFFISTQIHAQWWGKSIKGNGEVQKETRDVGEYDGVSVAGFFEVTLLAGSEGKITIEGESNLLNYIETVVDKGVLKIRVQKNQNLKTSWGNDIKITVPFRDIELVSLSGSGDIITKDVIKAKDFKVSVSGSGDVTLDVESSATKSRVTGSGDLILRGSTGDHESSVTGSGDINASRFNANYVDAKVTGSGDIKVYCSKYLKARVTGSGDIEYLGNPDKQETKVSGSGDITKG
ncbi:head GIN domain-containing protein [Dokdonia sp. Hel_I_53]|uniref:head GIN domain-containing protein n=1 Tax=Dokdonia sp. Hel_I_53 TaxID=1566287 RepID=UPI0011A81DA0|nr:head GIN domain-containing protein [Dokdonia sp. Hel_I_53]